MIRIITVIFIIILTTTFSQAQDVIDDDDSDIGCYNCFIDAKASCNDGTEATARGSSFHKYGNVTMLVFDDDESVCLDAAAKDAFADLKAVCDDGHGGIDESTRQFFNEEVRKPAYNLDNCDDLVK